VLTLAAQLALDGDGYRPLADAETKRRDLRVALAAMEAEHQGKPPPQVVHVAGIPPSSSVGNPGC
jgi:hypothetical protein